MPTRPIRFGLLSGNSKPKSLVNQEKKLTEGRRHKKKGKMIHMPYRLPLPEPKLPFALTKGHLFPFTMHGIYDRCWVHPNRHSFTSVKWKKDSFSLS